MFIVKCACANSSYPVLLLTRKWRFHTSAFDSNYLTNKYVCRIMINNQFLVSWFSST